MNFKYILSILMMSTTLLASAFEDERVEWWKNFNDPVLDSLIYLGQNNNLDLAQAMRRLEMARQDIREAKSGYYPKLSIGAGWERDRSSGFISRQNSDAMISSYFSLGVDMNWEVDLFGRINQQVKEAKGAYNASREDYDWMCVTITSEIATDYITLRTLQQELNVTQQHIDQQKRVLEITEERHEAGLVSKLDVAQAKTVFYSTQASIITLKTQIASTINAIAVLTGTYPSEMRQLLSTESPLPHAEWSGEINITPELLQNRPDVKEAEYTVEQYAAALGVEKKQWLPTLSITGSVGVEAWYLKDLFKGNSFTYSIAPQLSWTVFDGMARDAEIASAREQMMSAIDNYTLTLLTAVQEADNALTAYCNALEYEKEIMIVLENARLAYNLSIDRYKQGLDAFINVSDALITELEYANELVVARGNVLSALITLQKCLLF